MRDEAGFTLVELLVAMAAASLLIGSLSWVVSTLGHQLASARNADHAADVDAIRPLLTNLLEAASPEPGPDRRFEGRADGLSAVVPPPAALGPVGPVRLVLDVRSSPEGDALYAQFSSLDRESPLPEPFGTPRRLVSGMRSIDFAYDPRPSTSGLATPEQITVRMRDQERNLPEIVIRPRLNTTGRCTFDPIAMTCRP